MSGSSSKENSTSTATVTPTGLEFAKPAFQNQLKTFNQEYGKATANPGLVFAPAFSNGYDPIVQNAISKGTADINAGQDAAQRDLASRLSVIGTGDNSALLATLGRQGEFAKAGAQASLQPAALEQQRGFDVQRQSILDAQNRVRLAEQQNRLAALGQQGGLLQTLAQLTGAGAGKRATQTGETTTESSKNIFGTLFG